MKRLFLKLNHHHIFVILIITSLFVVTSIGWWFLKSYQNEERSLRNQIHREQLTLIKLGSSSLGVFINEKKAELLSIAESKNLESDMLVYQKKAQGLKNGISGAGLIDREGKLIRLINPENITTGEGTDFSDRDYFKFVKDSRNKGQVFVTEPIISRAGVSIGKPIILFAAGIYDENNIFDGAIVLSVLTEYIKNNYVLPLKPNQDSMAFILDQNLTIISSQYDQLVGQNMPEYAKANEWEKKDSYLNGLELVRKGESGHLEWYWLDPSTKKVDRKLVAYAPLSLDAGRKWVIVLSTSYNAVLTPLNNLSKHQVVGLISALVSLIIFVIFIDLGFHIAQKDGYERAYRELIEKFKKKVKSGKF